MIDDRWPYTRDRGRTRCLNTTERNHMCTTRKHTFVYIQSYNIQRHQSDMGRLLGQTTKM